MRRLYIFLAVCLVLSACKKKKDPAPPDPPKQKTNRELLTSGKWVIDHGYKTSRSIYPPYDTGVSDITFHSCSLDDTLFFTETDKYVMHMGKVPCQEPFVVDSSSKWAFINNETQIEKSAGFSGDEVFTIDKLTEDSLTLHHGYIGIGSIQYTITYKNLK